MKKYLFISFLLIPISLFSAEEQLMEKTADHICNICTSKNKSRLAVYTFTDSNDKETSETEKYTTKIISLILVCKDIKIIDSSKIKKVMEEQTKGLSGIVDDETAPETGKLLGADALVFGQIDNKMIQIRMVDATTGEILGASVHESSDTNRATVKVEKFDKESSKMEFRRSQLRKQLEFLFREKPGVFLFMTSTDDEIAKFKEKSSRGYKEITSLLEKAPPDKKEKFNKSREMVLEIRKNDPKFDKRIIDGHKKILSRQPGEKGRPPMRRPPRRRR